MHHDDLLVQGIRNVVPERLEFANDRFRWKDERKELRHTTIAGGRDAMQHAGDNVARLTSSLQEQVSSVCWARPWSLPAYIIATCSLLASYIIVHDNEQYVQNRSIYMWLFYMKWIPLWCSYCTSSWLVTRYVLTYRLDSCYFICAGISNVVLLEHYKSTRTLASYFLTDIYRCRSN